MTALTLLCRLLYVVQTRVLSYTAGMVMGSDDFWKHFRLSTEEQKRVTPRSQLRSWELGIRHGGIYAHGRLIMKEESLYGLVTAARLPGSIASNSHPLKGFKTLPVTFKTQ
jgi:hypothetical protein